ncbi:ABC transporter ATP-binding protein [Clostridiaceae bacterium Marseille-Q3526]|nr:ABC transporter ATP-binding protein [Clostridiaceae bacterium Marseille-Q3526]
MSREILVCKGLGKKFGTRYALKDVDLTIESGKIIGLLGPNGSGKTTLMKLANGLLKPEEGWLSIDGNEPGVETKAVVSYLPDQIYFADWMRVSDLLNMFSDFYRDFDRQRAAAMLKDLDISEKARMKSLSKGNKEKVQLILVMSRNARLYLLDEPIGGVDPAAREYILQTILTNYSEDASVIISTHLIADVEKVLDEAVFLKEGRLVRHSSVDEIRETEGKSVDHLFREIFAVQGSGNGSGDGDR